jgi:hypothetical protein
MTTTALSAIDLATDSAWTPPTFPTAPGALQAVMDTLSEFKDPAKRSWVPGPTKPIELIEVSSFAQLPVILRRLQDAPDTVRLVFPKISTGDAVRDGLIEDEQKEIHALMSKRHATPIGALITEAYAKVEQSHIFLDVQTHATELQGILAWWRDNDNGWKLDAASQVKLQVAEVIDLSAGKNDAERDALRDILVRGVQDPATKDRFICILPNVEDQAKELAEQVINAVTTAAGLPAVDLTAIKVWISPSSVWSSTSLPVNPPSAQEETLAEIKIKLDRSQKIVPKDLLDPRAKPRQWPSLMFPFEWLCERI